SEQYPTGQHPTNHPVGASALNEVDVRPTRGVSYKIGTLTMAEFNWTRGPDKQRYT
ncbi:hypothetical protein MSG28_004847, partial [Choristoneura fumiferana]